MKKLLLFLGIIFIVNISVGQTIVDINPSVGNTPITDSLFAYESQTLTQDLIFNLHPGVYSESINIWAIQTTASAKLIFQSSTGNPADVVIQGLTNQTTITIGQAFVQFKNITIESDMANVINIDFTQGSPSDITVDSCILRASINDSTNSIFSCVNDKYVPTNNYTFTNNSFENGATAISFQTMNLDISEIGISNNVFHGQYYDVIDIEGVLNIVIKDNSIELGKSNYSAFDDIKGIELNNVQPNLTQGFARCEINDNRIYKSGVNNVRYTGIEINNCRGMGNQFLVSNNFIDIEGADSSLVGIYVQYSDTIRVLHNTVRTISQLSSAFSYIAIMAKISPFLDFQNNILYSSAQVFSCEEFGSGSPFVIDNNVYYTPDTANAFYVAIGYLNFADWQINYSFDANSVFDDPMLGGFNEPFFHNILIDNSVPRFIGVDFDMDQFARNTPNCDPGAKEQLFITLGNDTLLCFGTTLTLSTPTGLFSYLWNTGETTPDITVTTSGTYSVTVQESAGGPIAIDTIIVDYSSEIITVLSDFANPSCFGENTGFIELTTTGGVAPYSYYWQGAFLDTNKIENIPAGNYAVQIVDANNCFADTFFTLTQPDSIGISFTSPAFCGGCTGFIVSTVVGGTEPYTYSWSSGTMDTIAYDLCEGTYTLTIIDNNLCINTANYTITESAMAYISGNLSYSSGNVSVNDGKVELYKYFIDGASQLELVDENILSTGGSFEFTSVEPEEFYLRGIITSSNSNYDNVYTSYYLDGGDTTAWTGATMISLQCEDTLSNLNFVMYELAAPITGPGVFSGTITYNDGAKSFGEPVSGAEVFVEQEPNDEPIANTETDTSGTWTIGNIPVGTGYKIYIDIPGMPLISTYQNLVVESGDTINSDLNFFVDTLAGGGIYTDTTTFVVDINSETINIKTYPNPVNDYLTIESYFNNSIDISYSIIDINGREVMVKNKNNYQGNYSETINVSELQKGTYFINLRFNNSFYVKKFIKQ